MPDSIGRYQFSEMTRLIRDRLLAIRKTVDPSTGEEITSTITNQLISNTDILAKLNSAIIGTYADIMMRKPEMFESDRFISVERSVVDYAFPIGMLQFSQMFWKNSNLSIGISPSNYVPMICVDDAHDYNEQVGRYSAPTWRRIGSNFQLNDTPNQDNFSGIMVRGVFLPPLLMDDLASPTPPTARTYIQGPFPTIVQELLMLEAAKKLAQEKMQQQPGSLDEELQAWRMRVDIAIENAQHPRSVQFTSPYLIQSSYSGKRRGWRR